MKIEESHWSRKIKTGWQMMLPYLLLSVFLLLNLINIPLSAGHETDPYFVLMAIYYWAIYRPGLVPPLLCFLTGLLLDALSGVPLGLNAIILVGTQWAIRRQRRFLTGQPYITVMAGFAVIALGSGLLQWALIGLAHMDWGLPLSGLLSAGISILVFPLVSLLLNFIHRMLPVASRSFP